MGRTKSQGILTRKRFGRGESDPQRTEKQPSGKEVGNREGQSRSQEKWVSRRVRMSGVG